jgi:hypothetical protein
MKIDTQLNESLEISQIDAITQILVHDLDSFMNHDLQALMSDYTGESVFITQNATYTGPKEISDFFSNLLLHFPKQGSIFELDKMEVKAGLGFIVWHATTPSLVVPLGTDTFVIKEDKIFQQTFAGQLNFISN